MALSRYAVRAGYTERLSTKLPDAHGASMDGWFQITIPWVDLSDFEKGQLYEQARALAERLGPGSV
jgi:hypothetical protein